MDKLILYTNDDCPRCKLIKRNLREAGFEFEEIPASEVENKLVERGYLVLPVMEVNGEELLSFRFIRRYIKERVEGWKSR